MSLVRVLVDLAAHHPADLRTGFMEGSRLGLIDWRVVKFCVERSLGLPGSSEIRGLAGIWVPELRRIRSVLEGQFLLSWLEIGGKVPEVNVSMGPWSLDFLWREEGVVVETDGRAFHGHHMAREKDVRKDAWLAARGIKVIHLGYDEVNDPSGNAMHIVAQALKRVRGVVFGRYTPTNDTTCPLS